jgi:ketosteroid isomerase-like protein
MTRLLLRLVCGCLMFGLMGGGMAWAEECSGAITADEALSAEDARYTAQTTNDFAAMERMFGPDLVYFHSSAAVDNKTSYIESMRSGTVKYRTMRRTEVKVRTYGCLAIITGIVEVEVTSSGENLSLQLRFHSVWAKRSQGIQFISWQATRIPPKK